MSVYFVQAGDGSRIKIGFSPYPERRIKYLSRYSGPALITLAVIEGPRSLEFAIHQHLAAFRAHDEWFEPSPEVLEVVRRASLLPQDQGSNKDLHNAHFTEDELKALSKTDGSIGKAARAALSFPYSLTFAVLEGLIRLVGEDGKT